MKTNLLFLVFSFFIGSVTSQVKFEKGFVINNDGSKTYCLIKNKGWKTNPVKIEYKLSKDDDIKTHNLKDILSFGVKDKFIYEKYNVNVDLSSVHLSNLDSNSEMNYQNKTLFLRKIVEGKVDLFMYQYADNIKFFFKRDSDVIPIQLDYKKYIGESTYLNKQNLILENNLYKNQLLEFFNCENSSNINLQNLKYKYKDLVSYFNIYNQCLGYTSTEIKPKTIKKKNTLILKGRLGTNNFKYDLSIASNNYKFDFDNKLETSYALEYELIPSFFNNKWAFSFEAVYSFFKKESKIEDIFNISGNELYFNSNESLLIVFSGLKHNMFVSDNLSFYIGGQFSLFSLPNSDIEIKRKDGSLFFSDRREAKSVFEDFTISFGGRINNKINLELRYETIGNSYKNSVSSNNRNSNLSTISLSLGYNFFK